MPAFDRTVKLWYNVARNGHCRSEGGYNGKNETVTYYSA